MQDLLDGYIYRAMVVGSEIGHISINIDGRYVNVKWMFEVYATIPSRAYKYLY